MKGIKVEDIIKRELELIKESEANMGFVTESQMRTDYTSLFNKEIGDTPYYIQGWLTPNGILIEVIKQTMDS